jgi:hypothetical protein
VSPLARAAGALCAVLALAPARAGEAEYTVSLQSELRARSSLPGDEGTGPTVDFELLPVAAGRLGGAGFLFDLSYRPSLVFRDLPGTGPFLPLHRVSAALQWQRVWTLLQLRGEGARGLVDLGPLLTNDGLLGPVVVPASTTLGLVNYERLMGSLSLQQGLSAHVWLLAEGAYEVSGSTDNVQLPLQWGPRGVLQVRVEATQVDTLTTGVVGSHADFSTGQSQTVVEVTQRWARRLSRQLLGEATAGLAAVKQQVLPQTAGDALRSTLAVEPVASLGLTASVPLRFSTLELRASVGLEPFSDRFTATVYERLDGKVGAAWVLRKELALGLALSAARSFPPASGATPPDFYVAAETTVALTLQPWLVLGAALRASHTELLTPGSTPNNQWLTSLSVTVRNHESTSW